MLTSCGHKHRLTTNLVFYVALSSFVLAFLPAPARAQQSAQSAIGDGIWSLSVSMRSDADAALALLGYKEKPADFVAPALTNWQNYISTLDKALSASNPPALEPPAHAVTLCPVVGGVLNTTTEDPVMYNGVGELLNTADSLKKVESSTKLLVELGPLLKTAPTYGSQYVIDWGAYGSNMLTRTKALATNVTAAERKWESDVVRYQFYRDKCFGYGGFRIEGFTGKFVDTSPPYDLSVLAGVISESSSVPDYWTSILAGLSPHTEAEIDVGSSDINITPTEGDLKRINAEWVTLSIVSKLPDIPDLVLPQISDLVSLDQVTTCSTRADALSKLEAYRIEYSNMAIEAKATIDDLGKSIDQLSSFRETTKIKLVYLRAIEPLIVGMAGPVATQDEWDSFAKAITETASDVSTSLTDRREEMKRNSTLVDDLIQRIKDTPLHLPPC